MVKVVEGTLPLRRTEDMLVPEGGMEQVAQQAHMQHLYRPTPTELPTPMEVCLHQASVCAFVTW